MRVDGAARRIEDAFAAVLETPEVGRDVLLSTLLTDPSEIAEVRRLLVRHASLEGSGETFLSAVDPALAAALLDATAPAPETIGRYVVEHRIGRGGNGVVYLAHDPELGRPVAIKVLPPERAGSSAARDRLRAEARAVSALDHPHIAAIHEIGQTEVGELYIVMGYYGGETLRTRLSRGPLPVDEALRIGMELADALAATHDRGIVHRDVKPENVVLTDRGVRLVDFGIAATADSAGPTGAAGTVAYMSPEQSRGEPPEPCTDVWALGVVLYEMLAGRRPFEGPDADLTGEAVRTLDPAPLRRLRTEVPGRLARTVHACLSRDVRERPPTAGAVRRRLAPHGARGRVVVGAAALLLAVGGVSGVLLSRRPVPAVPAGPDPVAADLYVQGMALLERRTPDDLEQAAVFLREAIDRDSTFARAYAGLARVLAQSRVERPSDLFARTGPLLERAAALDPDVPGVLDELGWIKMWHDRDWAGAEPYLRRALQLAPTDPWTYHYYAAWLSVIGRIDEAVALERRAMVVDPRGAATATHVGLHLTMQGKYEDAIELLETALRTDTTWGRTHAALGRAYLAVGRYEEALEHLRRDNYQFAGFDSGAVLAYGLGIAGQREEALAITERFERRAGAGYTNPVNLMACYLGLGDIERALEWAERIPDDPGVLWFPRSDPMFEPLFAEPRFQRVLVRVGLDSASVARLPDTRAEIEAILRP